MPIQQYAIESILDKFRSRVNTLLHNRQRQVGEEYVIPYENLHALLYSGLTDEAKRQHHGQVEVLKAADVHLRPTDKFLSSMSSLLTDSNWRSDRERWQTVYDTKLPITTSYHNITRYATTLNCSGSPQGVVTHKVECKVANHHLHIGSDKGNLLFTRTLCDAAQNDVAWDTTYLPQAIRDRIQLVSDIEMAYGILTDVMYRCGTLIQALSVLPTVTHPLFMGDKRLVKLLENSKDRIPKKNYQITKEAKELLTRTILPLIMVREHVATNDRDGVALANTQYEEHEDNRPAYATKNQSRTHIPCVVATSDLVSYPFERGQLSLLDTVKDVDAPVYTLLDLL